MRASQWDTDAEIGGAWRVVLRRVAQNEPIVLAAPTTMNLWASGLEPATAPPTKTITATIAPNGLTATLLLSANEVLALGPGRFQHRVVVTDGGGLPTVLLRGWMTVRGAVDDL